MRGRRAQEAGGFGFGPRDSGKPFSFSLASDTIGLMFWKSSVQRGKRVGQESRVQAGEGGVWSREVYSRDCRKKYPLVICLALS